MEQYQSMAKSIENLKKPLVIIAAISMLTHLIILGAGIVINQEGKVVKYTTFEACHKGMTALFSNNPIEGLFHKKVIQDIKEHKFEIDRITLVKAIDSYNCDVIAKDSKGFRSYRVALEKNSKFPHLYKIFDVQGQKLVSSYQWKERL